MQGKSVFIIKEKGRYIFNDQRVENILPFPVMQSIVINPIQNTWNELIWLYYNTFLEKKRWQIKKNNAKRIVFLFASEKIDSLGNVSKVISDARW